MTLDETASFKKKKEKFKKAHDELFEKAPDGKEEELAKELIEVQTNNTNLTRQRKVIKVRMTKLDELASKDEIFIGRIMNNYLDRYAHYLKKRMAYIEKMVFYEKKLGYGEPAGVLKRLEALDEKIFDSVDYDRLFEKPLFKTSEYAMQGASAKNVEKLTKLVGKLK